jgi:hypothetical protein
MKGGNRSVIFPATFLRIHGETAFGDVEDSENIRSSGDQEKAPHGPGVSLLTPDSGKTALSPNPGRAGQGWARAKTLGISNALGRGSTLPASMPVLGETESLSRTDILDSGDR